MSIWNNKAQDTTIRPMDPMELRPGMKARFIEALKDTPINRIQWGFIGVDTKGRALFTEDVRINNIEDRGEFLYVGYTPLDCYHHGQWGYTRIYKQPGPEFGTLLVGRL